MLVFSHITNIIKMHQFPVHKLHSLHTPVTIMYSSNGCSSNVLVLQKIFWMQFVPKFPFILLNPYSYFLCLSVIPPPNQSALYTHQHHANSPIFLVTITISPILQHITLHNTVVPPVRQLKSLYSPPEQVLIVWDRGGPTIVVSVFPISDREATSQNLDYTQVSEEPFLYTIYLSRYYFKINLSICYSIIYHKFHTQINNSNY